MEHDRVPSLVGLPLTEKLLWRGGGRGQGKGRGLTPCEVAAVLRTEDTQTVVGGLG